MSDWHWNLSALPPADVYVCTGDMYDNYLKWSDFGRVIDKEREARYQRRDAAQMKRTFKADLLGAPDAPVVCVRGNHDFIDLAQMFGGCDVREIHDPEDVFEIGGMRFGGFRGVPKMYGEWSDEEEESVLEARCKRLPRDLDVVLTHCPPYGFLDQAWRGERYGSPSLASWVNSFSYSSERFPRLFCFGHIHEDAGKKFVHGEDDEVLMTFSNAACTWHELDI